MKEEIVKLVSLVTKKDETELINNENSPDAWDSITHVDVVVTLEEQYDLMFTPDEVAKMRTLSGLVKIIEEKTSNEA